MRKIILFPVALLLAIIQSSLVQGQYTYFDSLYWHPDPTVFQRRTFDVQVVDGKYVCFEEVGTQNTGPNVGVFDQNGEAIQSTIENSEGTMLMLPGRADHMIQHSGGDLFWVGYAYQMSVGYVGLIYKVYEEGLAPELLVYYQSEEAYANNFHCLAELSDGSLLAIGTEMVVDDVDQWIFHDEIIFLKFDTDGDILSSDVIDLMSQGNYEWTGVWELEDGNILLLGMDDTASNNLICLIDSQYELQWTHEWGTDGLTERWPWGLLEDDNVLTVLFNRGLTNATSEVNASGVPCLMQFDLNTQSVLWEVEYDDHELYSSTCLNLEKGVDNSYNLLGYASSSELQYTDTTYTWLINTDQFGNEQWFRQYGVNLLSTWAFTVDHFYDLEVTPDGGYILAGTRSYQEVWGLGQYQTHLLKIDSCGEIEDFGCEPVVGVNSHDRRLENILFPNPTEGEFSITNNWENLEITDTSGRVLYSSIHQETVDVSSFPSGMYYVWVDNECHRLIKD